MLEKLKLLLGIAESDDSKDELLELLISNAKTFAISFCGYDEYTNKLDTVVLKMVLEDYNRLGSEGIASRSFSGISENYSDDYSVGIYTLLKRFKKVILL